MSETVEVDIRAVFRTIALGRVPLHSPLGRALAAARTVGTTDRLAERRYRFVGTADLARGLVSAAERWSPTDVPEIRRATNAARRPGSTRAVATMARPAQSQAGEMLVGAIRLMAGGE
jgi:hypothetical protein